MLHMYPGAGSATTLLDTVQNIHQIELLNFLQHVADVGDLGWLHVQPPSSSVAEQL